METSYRFRAILVSASLLFVGSADFASAATSKNKAPKVSPATTSLDDYIRRVTAAGAEKPSTLGSLWVATGPLSDVASDYKARMAGDPIVVQLVDTFSAATNGENKTSRQFSTSSAITSLLRNIPASNALQNLLSANSNTSLDGKGASTMSSNLQLSLAGRVVQQLPNGMLVIEASRDFTVGNDRQTVVLHGLVRPGDIAPNNSIQSTSVASLELEIKGKGAVADASAKPSLLMRVLLKLFSF
ncbi:MAG TPA: flagellar basal body L-ring protein FlgH [Candidatus Acidoferrales bacterium]|nr:flagellar basal body L-ring protein FlgH [Candidatus Acidoferrales bacterium]